MANTGAGAGGAGGAPGARLPNDAGVIIARDGERGAHGVLLVETRAIICHEKIYVAYVYDMRGELLRWRVFTHDIDAAAWARKKAAKLACQQPRELLPGLGMAPPPPELPWSVRVYTNGGGTSEPA